MGEVVAGGLAFAEDAGRWVGDRIGDLTGATQTREAMEAEAARSRAQAQQMLQAAQAEAAALRGEKAQAFDLQQQGYNQAIDLLQPMAQQGMQAQQRYMDFLGQGPQGYAMGNMSGPGQNLYELAGSGIHTGPLEESSMYQGYEAAKQQAIDDLTSQAGASGMMFSGPRAKKLAEVSGRMQQQLEQRQYQRNQQGLQNLFNLGEADRRSTQNWLNRMGALGQGGQQMTGNIANLMLGRGGIGNQGFNQQQAISNLLMGGQQQAGAWNQLAGQQNIMGAQAQQQAMGDIIGAIGSIAGSYAGG